MSFQSYMAKLGSGLRIAGNPARWQRSMRTVTSLFPRAANSGQ